MNILGKQVNHCSECPFCSNDNEYGDTCNITKEYMETNYSYDSYIINPNCPITKEQEEQLNKIKLCKK